MGLVSTASLTELLADALARVAARPGPLGEFRVMAEFLLAAFRADGVTVACCGDDFAELFPDALDLVPLAEGATLARLEEVPTEPGAGRLVVPFPGGACVVHGARGSGEEALVAARIAASFCAYAVRTNVEVAAGFAKVRQLEKVRLSLTEQNIKLRDYAVIDELTGLRNRRFINRTLTYELERHRRYDRPLSLVLLDIDHFKVINDTRGHLVGDAVLCAVARRLESAVRGSDAPARYGGEEFAVVLPESPADGARIVAERIRHAVAEKPAEGLVVTVSCGVATAEGRWSGDDSALVREADRALYEAKRTGRNRVVATRLGAS